MPMELNLKARARAVLRPWAAALAAQGVTPSRLTLIGVVAAAVVGALLAAAPAEPIVLVLLPAAVAARLVLTALDRMLADEHGLGSPRDQIVNEVGNAAADALLYLPLALHPGVAGWLVVAVVVLGLIAEIAGLAALTIGGERRTDGPQRSTDRALLFGVIGLILAADPRAAAWLPWLLVPAAALTGVTIYNRMRPAG